MTSHANRALARLDHFRAVPGPVRRLVVISIVDAAGTGLFLAAATVGFVRFAGLSGFQLGIGLSLGGVAGLLCAVPWGIGVDRFGPRRVLAAISLWRAAGFVGYAAVHSFPAFLAIACFLGVADRAAGPATQALVGTVVPGEQRVATMAGIRAARNVGFAAAGVVAGLALALDVRYAFVALLLANAASFVFVASMAATLPAAPHAATPAAAPTRRVAFLDRPFLAVTALNGVLTLHMTLLAIGIPLVVAQHPRAPAALTGPLLTLNTVLCVLLQMRVGRGASTVAGSARCLRRGGGALVATCVLLASVERAPTVLAVGLLCVAAVALTAGELLQSAGAWGVSYHLSRPGQEGAYLSVFSLGLSLQTVLGPLLIVTVVSAGPLGWLGLSVALAAAGLAVPPAVKRASPPAAGSGDRDPSPAYRKGHNWMPALIRRGSRA